MKDPILAAIGEIGLQRAASLDAGLAANDRVKYAFSLLQMAIDHAEHPKQQTASLKQERVSCGIDDPDLDTVVADACMVDTLSRSRRHPDFRAHRRGHAPYGRAGARCPSGRVCRSTGSTAPLAA